MNRSTTRRRLLGTGTAILLLSAAGCTTREKVEGNKDPAADTRLIEFGLWAGVPGAQFGAPIDVTTGSRRIRGPITWTHPITKQEMRVYERRNRDEAGDKVQLFSVNAEGSALGRVFDSRPGQADRYFSDDAFFPIGRWGRGEQRSFSMTEYQDGQARSQTATIRIRRLSFENDGFPKSLKYDWILYSQDGEKIFDERYVYSPGIGFAEYQNRLS